MTFDVVDDDDEWEKEESGEGENIGEKKFRKLYTRLWKERDQTTKLSKSAAAKLLKKLKSWNKERTNERKVQSFLSPWCRRRISYVCSLPYRREVVNYFNGRLSCLPRQRRSTKGGQKDWVDGGWELQWQEHLFSLFPSS